MLLQSLLALDVRGMLLKFMLMYSLDDDIDEDDDCRCRSKLCVMLLLLLLLLFVCDRLANDISM